MMQHYTEPVGKRGFLAFFIFYLIMSGLVMFVWNSDLDQAIRLAADPEIQQQLLENLQSDLLAVSLLTASVFFFAAWKAAYGTRRSDIMTAMKCMWLGFAMFTTLSPWVVSAYFEYPSRIIAEFVFEKIPLNITWGGIWTLYIFRSVRVRNTYPAAGAKPAVRPQAPAPTGRHSFVHLQEPAPAPAPPAVLAPEPPPPQPEPEPPARPARSGLGFVMLRTDDEKWRWLLADIATNRVLAKGRGHDSRDACLVEVCRIREGLGGAGILDKTAGKWVG